MIEIESPVHSQGLWLRCHADDLRSWSGMTQRVTSEIISEVARIKGPDAAKILKEHGIHRLHEVIDAKDVGAIREAVLERLRQPLLAMAVSVGREILGWRGDFYVDDYLILRINFPYEVAVRSDLSAENPGIGRLSPSVRSVHQGRKVIDPVYDPKSYHRGQPPAAWAHGPHRDSWAGHSRDGRNIWWAIGNVPAEAGMVLYPELADENLPCDPRSLYLRAGYPLPKPTQLPLKTGEMLVFDPEVLHGTHLNTTNESRVAVSMRLNASRPKFDPACFYAREFWRRATNIEDGIDEVIYLRREDNLGPPTQAKPIGPVTALPMIAGTFDEDSNIVCGFPGEAFGTGHRVIVEAGSYRVLLVRSRDGLRAYDDACPVNGADLADGGCDGGKTYCPACAVGFDLETGKSSCPSLALRRYEAWESDGAVLIRVAA
jgi:nitrite reductase/ring-hydroxylating ferredoxin subunit